MSNYYQPDPTIEHFEDQTDEWHTHGAGEPAPQPSHGEVSPKWISLGLIVSFIGVFATIWGFAFMFKVVKDQELAAKREIDTGRDAAEIIARAKADLTTVQWMDEKAGLVKAPITLAMQDVIAEYTKAQAATLARPAATERK